jgi:hypothetical protein
MPWGLSACLPHSASPTTGGEGVFLHPVTVGHGAERTARVELTASEARGNVADAPRDEVLEL